MVNVFSTSIDVARSAICSLSCDSSSGGSSSDSTLSNAEINWAVSKLADYELITVESFPDERIIREVDGQRRSFSRPKAVALTARGETVATALEGGLSVFEPMDHGDLIRTVQLLDQRMADLEEKVEMQRHQFLQKLREVADDE